MTNSKVFNLDGTLVKLSEIQAITHVQTYDTLHFFQVMISGQHFQSKKSKDKSEVEAIRSELIEAWLLEIGGKL